MFCNFFRKQMLAKLWSMFREGWFCKYLCSICLGQYLAIGLFLDWLTAKDASKVAAVCSFCPLQIYTNMKKGENSLWNIWTRMKWKPKFQNPDWPGCRKDLNQLCIARRRHHIAFTCTIWTLWSLHVLIHCNAFIKKFKWGHLGMTSPSSSGFC